MIYQHENSVSTFGRRRLVVRSSMVHFNWSLVLMMPKKIVLETLRRLTAKPLDFSTRKIQGKYAGSARVPAASRSFDEKNLLYCMHDDPSSAAK